MTVRLELRLLDVAPVRRETNGAVIGVPVSFASGKSDVSPAMETKIARIATVLAQEPDTHLRIEAYSDGREDKQDRKVSQMRANAVRDELVRRGVAAERIDAVGRGAGFPIASDTTEAGRAQNRRMSIVVLSPGAAR
jgi:outer membrane protein OmpA-like peptidoglycan-associated protein